MVLVLGAALLGGGVPVRASADGAEGAIASAADGVLGPVAEGAAACAPQAEYGASGATLRLRPHRNELLTCQLSEADYHRLLAGWLKARDATTPVQGIFLGRAVDYPWLSRALARAALTAPRWDARRGRARGAGNNSTVADLLGSGALRARLAAPLTEAGLHLAAVSVEKVLVGPAAQHVDAASAGLVPFDAQVWLRLAAPPPH